MTIDICSDIMKKKRNLKRQKEENMSKKKKYRKHTPLAYFFGFLSIPVFVLSLVGLYFYGTWVFMGGVVFFITCIILMDRVDRT